MELLQLVPKREVTGVAGCTMASKYQMMTGDFNIALCRLPTTSRTALRDRPTRDCDP